MKVLLILCDGMRPDSLESVPKAQSILGRSAYTLDAQTVMPSVTLPCHISLFHSVDPSRHGTTTNTYAPQVRPIDGLYEILHRAGKSTAMFYDWEELRDVSRPGNTDHLLFCSGHFHGYRESGEILTDAATEFLNKNDIDFTFLYFGWPDAEGHGHGWMSEPYLESVKGCFERINRIMNSLSEDYVYIITADHGGHERFHGTEAPEDMTIPIIIAGKEVSSGRLENANIKDIAPTVAKLLGAEPDGEWEGRSLI